MINMDNVIEERIESIGKFYLKDYINDSQQSYISLHGGRGGSVLIQYLYFIHTKEKSYKDEINKNIEFLIHELEKSKSISFTFCNGLAGIGWLLLFLSEKKIILLNNDEFFEDIDYCLSKTLDNFLHMRNFDLLHGAMGVAFYFLKRGDYYHVEKMINFLFNSCEEVENETKWRRFADSQSFENFYDFGLAHGQASILYFLGKCCKYRVLHEKCEKMIMGIVNFYLNNTQNLDIAGSYFPKEITCQEYKSQRNKVSRSRLAWCYGDLGILHTLILVTGWVGLKVHREKFEKMLVNVSSRRDAAETLVQDAQFCHGSSGVSYLYLSAYRLTGNKVFKNASNYWLNQVLKAGKNGRGDSGYLFSDVEHGWADAVDILGGLGGVALLLLTHKHPDYTHDWDECLFIS